MSDIRDLDRVRPAPWPDESWLDTTSGEEVERLRRQLADAVRQRSTSQEPSALLTSEVRRLAGEVAAMKAALPPLLATIPDAARVLEVSISTVRRGIRDGSIPYRRIGHSVRVDLSRCHGIDADDVAQLARAARNGR